MKKIFLLSVAALMTTGAIFACDGHGKTAKKDSKSCSATAKKGGKKGSCCSKGAKATVAKSTAKA